MSDTTEALFLALANVEEATRARRASTRRRPRVHTPVAVEPAELAAALQLIHNITTELGQTVWHYGHALYAARDGEQEFSPRSALAYDVARELHALAKQMRPGAPVSTALAAVTALDSAVKDQRGRHRHS